MAQGPDERRRRQIAADRLLEGIYACREAGINAEELLQMVRQILAQFDDDAYMLQVLQSELGHVAPFGEPGDDGGAGERRPPRVTLSLPDPPRAPEEKKGG